MVVMLTNDLLEGRLNIIIRQRFKFNKRNKNQGATGPVGIISDNELLGRYGNLECPTAPRYCVMDNY